MDKRKFNTGLLIATAEVSQWCEIKHKFSLFIEECLIKHTRGNWGDLTEEDKESNDFALTNNERILSSYNLPEDWGVSESKIWIITEYDRRTTTILFPSEY